MLVIYILIYALISVLGVSFWMKKENSSSYRLNCRFNAPVLIGVICATWLGAETLLVSPGECIKEGFLFVIGDSLGGSLSLIVMALFFVRPWYRRHQSTVLSILGERYGRFVLILATFPVVLSYIVWMSSQWIASGVILHVTSNGVISESWGMLLIFSVVLLYFFLGSRSSALFSDSFQIFIMFFSLLLIFFDLFSQIDPLQTLEWLSNDNFLHTSSISKNDILLMLSGIFAVSFGSIPQQDIYESLLAAQNEKIAAKSLAMSSAIYFPIAILPIIILQLGKNLHFDVAQSLSVQEHLIFPLLIIQNTSFLAKFLFFGSLLSALISTTSSTLIIPISVILNNIYSSSYLNQANVFLIKLLSACLGACVLLACILGKEYIGSVTRLSYEFTVVSILVPIVSALFFKNSSSTGAIISVFMGLIVWASSHLLASSGYHGALFSALLSSTLGMLLGTLWDKRSLSPSSESLTYQQNC